MPVLPVPSARDVVRVFERFGWSASRQRGSHIVLTKPNHMATLSVPDHKEVARGTLRSLVRAAGMTVETFVAEAEKL